MNDDLSDLTRSLAEQGHQSRSTAQRLVDEVLAHFREPLEDYVARRHRELVAQDLKNDAIYALIAEELRTRLVAAPQLSARQIRRLIYG